MIRILSEIIEDNYLVTRYTKDGVSVSHEIKTPIQTEPIELPVITETQPTIEQQILAELQYNTALTEIKAFGGM